MALFFGSDSSRKRSSSDVVVAINASVSTNPDDASISNCKRPRRQPRNDASDVSSPTPRSKRNDDHPNHDSSSSLSVDASSASTDSTPSALEHSSTTSSSTPTSSLSALPELPQSQSAFTAPTTKNANANDNSNNNNSDHNDSDNHNIVHHGHRNEYFTAISAAKARLEAARSAFSRSRDDLSRARSELARSSEEVKQSQEFLRGVERRWGVVDLECDGDGGVSHDADDDDDDDGDRGSNAITDSGHGDETNGGGWDDNTRLVTADDNNNASGSNVNDEDCNHNSLSTAPEGCSIRCIQVSRAGESMVNGRYDLVSHNDAAFDSRQFQESHHHNHNLHPNNGPMYVHAEGPFSVQNELHDVCIFRKGGYGNKLRWCVGLVPCRFDASSDDTAAVNDRRRNFALAYVYYWMEVDAANASDVSSLMFSDDNCEACELAASPSSSSWGVCHGVRPLPVLEEVGDDGDSRRRWWWPFWKG